jgi:NAD(P)H dehydrogenase (quinone)
MNDIILLVGSPWGAGTYAGPKGERVPTDLEKEIAKTQGGAFYDVVSRVSPVQKKSIN